MDLEYLMPLCTSSHNRCLHHLTIHTPMTWMPALVAFNYLHSLGTNSSTMEHGLPFSGQGLYQKDPIYKKTFTGCIFSPHRPRSKTKMTWRSIIKLKTVHHVSMAYMFNTITPPSQKDYTFIILPKLGPCHQVRGPPTTSSLTWLISTFIYF
jgi:hypothetical protein